MFYTPGSARMLIYWAVGVGRSEQTAGRGILISAPGFLPPGGRQLTVGRLFPGSLVNSLINQQLSAWCWVSMVFKKYKMWLVSLVSLVSLVDLAGHLVKYMII